MGRIVVSEIGSAHAAATRRVMRPELQLLDNLVKILFKICRKGTDRSACGVARDMIEEGAARGPKVKGSMACSVSRLGQVIVNT